MLSWRRGRTWRGWRWYCGRGYHVTADASIFIPVCVGMIVEHDVKVRDETLKDDGDAGVVHEGKAGGCEAFRSRLGDTELHTGGHVEAKLSVLRMAAMFSSTSLAFTSPWKRAQAER